MQQQQQIRPGAGALATGVPVTRHGMAAGVHQPCTSAADRQPSLLKLVNAAGSPVFGAGTARLQQHPHGTALLMPKLPLAATGPEDDAHLPHICLPSVSVTRMPARIGTGTE